MKKALSLFLAVLMIFAAMSVSASAAPAITDEDWFGPGRAANLDQAIFYFDLNGGTLKNPAPVFNTTTGTFSNVSNITGTYIMVPQGGYAMTANTSVTLPVVTPPAGYQFDGWHCSDGQYYAANAPFTITTAYVGHFTYFTAAYSPAEIEEDTMSKIMGILIQIFGAIIGLIMFAGDTSAGIEMMEKVLGGLF